MVELDLLELEEVVEVDVELVEVELGVVVGVGVGVGVGEALEDLAPEPLELPAGKTTTFAVSPLGMVTTQKFAPPAPEAWSALVTPPTPLLEGSMLHGVPLQPEPEQTILTPKLGGVLARCESMKIGFQPIFANVLPLASVLAPAT